MTGGLRSVPFWLGAAVIVIVSCSCARTGATIRVPDDAPTIQEAVDRAQDGDSIIVAPGVYLENVRIQGKSVVLASTFLASGDSSRISETILDGQGATVLHIEGSSPGTSVVGLTIRNGDDGIWTDSRIEILSNRFIGNTDAIDYEGGGGICRANVFALNKDDAVDLDGPCDVTIEHNVIRSNGDDGIEIRVHPYQGPVLNVVIRDNVITGNGEDGIQFIDYGTRSSRTYRIVRNLLENNAMAAVGCMGDGNTRENYESAEIPEPILFAHNVVVGNRHGITGGANLASVNNIFMGIEGAALKQVNGKSTSLRNLFWGNGTDNQESNWDEAGSLFQNPGLDQAHRPTAGSPCVDRGLAQFEWSGLTLRAPREAPFLGSGPDIGAYEREPGE